MGTPQTFVTIPLDTARMIDRAFLPRNPNKLRGDMKGPAREAALAFKKAVYDAESGTVPTTFGEPGTIR